MGELIIPLLIGGIVIFLGIENMKGNISTLHSYHRKRVREEDRIPYGKEVGLGTILVGSALILRTAAEFAAVSMKSSMLEKTGTVIMVLGLAAGFALIIHAMLKYNKGIF